jgi:hypothetical protein
MPICIEIVKSSYFIDWLFLSLDCDFVQNFFNHEQNQEDKIYYVFPKGSNDPDPYTGLRLSTDPNSDWYPYANRWEYYRSFFVNRKYIQHFEDPEGDPDQWDRWLIFIDRDKYPEVKRRRWWREFYWEILFWSIGLFWILFRPSAYWQNRWPKKLGNFIKDYANLKEEDIDRNLDD